MTYLLFSPLPTGTVRALQNGKEDAHGHLPEKYTSDGSGLPCRHCLDQIEKGEEFLVLSYKPFETQQPYAEQGPIFLHARECDVYSNRENLPKMYTPESSILLRGYSRHDRIVYGTGQIVLNAEVEHKANEILATKGVAYIHARSASNNCFQYRIDPKF